MVVSIKSMWNGKAAGAPNFQPLWFASSNLGLGQSYPGLVAREPGRYHSWVYSACNAIIQPFLDLPVVLYRKENEEDLIEEHPLLDLMKKPNPYMGGTNFFEAILWDLLLTTVRTPGGQAFIIGEKPTNFRKGEIPKELWVFGDDAMTARVDSNGILVGWTFGFGAQTMDLTLDQVIRINLFNKYDWKQGMSPLAAAVIEVDQDAKAKEFNTRFLENNAMPGGMVSLDGAPPDKQIWESLKTMWAEKYAGFQNAGKTVFMPWMLKFEQFARSHLDFSYMEQLGWNRDAILAAYRVNKWSVGISEDLNYATAKEATRQLIERCVLPLARVIFTSLNENWIRYIDKRNLRIKLDLSEAQALKEDRSIKVKDAGLLIDQGLPPTAAYEFVGLDIDTKPFPWLSEDRSLAGQFSQQLEADKEMVASRQNEPKKPNEAPKKSAVVITKDERDALSKSYIEKLFQPGEKEMLPAITRYFTSQRNAMQAHVQEVLKGLPSLSGIDPKTFLLDRKVEDAGLIRTFQPLFINQTKRTLRGLRSEMKALSLDSTEEEIREFLKSRLFNLSEINNTTFAGVEASLAEIVTAGIEQYSTMPELGKAISDGIFDVYQGRLKQTGMIARTETATVTNGVRFEVFQSSGIEKQEWLTAKDGRVRETHVAEDGHIVPIGDRFPSTGLLHPNDPHGPAHEVINCFPAGVLVLTQHGEVPIESVRCGDMVLTHRNRWRRVIERHISSEKREVIQVLTAGGRTFRITPAHKLFVVGKGWIEAESLQCGDKLVDQFDLIAINNSIGEIEHPHPELLGKDQVPVWAQAGFAPKNFNSSIEVGKVDVNVIVGVIRHGEFENVYNLGVDEDMSYFAAGFLGRNCRCVALAVEE